MSKKPAATKLVILDRDGVINRDSSDFVKSADDWIPLDGSILAIAALSKAGFTIAIASNQSGLARGLFEQAALDTMHEKLHGLVSAAGGCVDRIVVCPHAPGDGCDCRKPKAGMLYEIAKHYAVSLHGVPIIGDSLRDLQAAVAAQARPILVRTGNGQQTAEKLPAELAEIDVYENLAAAATALLAE